MPGEYLKGFPDPPNSPNEKFLVPGSPHLWEDDIFADLVGEGIDRDTARALARAMSRHEERKAVVEGHRLRELEWWANIHTHSTGEGVTNPFEIPPYRFLHLNNQDIYQSFDHGQSWTLFEGRSTTARRRPFAFNNDIWHPGNIRWSVDVFDENGNRAGYNIKGTGTNGNTISAGGYSRELGLLFMAGGNATDGRVDLFTGPDDGVLKADDADGNDWTRVGRSDNEAWDVAVLSNGALVAVTKSQGSGNIPKFVRSDDGVNWTSVPTEDSESNTLEFCSIQEHKGLLVALEVQAPGGIYTSSDGGTTWEKQADSGATDSNLGLATSNGHVILAGRRNGIWRSEDGINWTVLPDTDNQEWGPVAWDGTAWIVGTRWQSSNANDPGRVRYCPDPLGLEDWQVAQEFGSNHSIALL